MGLFDKLFGKKETSNSNIISNNSTVSMSTVSAAKSNVNSMIIDMSKHTEKLNTVLIDMSKSSKIDMSKHTARVALAMDYSGSMSNLFSNGSVQNVVTRLLPIALKFDNNGELESWLFSNSQEKLEPVTINNYKDYVKKVMRKARMDMGGTNYAPVLKDIFKYYEKIEPSTIPAFIIFITDGDNWDTNETDKIVKKISEYNIFIQFIGIGNDNFNYLKSLDDMEGRKKDNTGFITVRDMNKMSDKELYTTILKQYKDWLNNK